jgi:hypothetical protein
MPSKAKIIKTLKDNITFTEIRIVFVTTVMFSASILFVPAKTWTARLLVLTDDSQFEKYFALEYNQILELAKNQGSTSGSYLIHVRENHLKNRALSELSTFNEEDLKRTRIRTRPCTDAGIYEVEVKSPTKPIAIEAARTFARNALHHLPTKSDFYNQFANKYERITEDSSAIRNLNQNCDTLLKLTDQVLQLKSMQFNKNKDLPPNNADIVKHKADYTAILKSLKSLQGTILISQSPQLNNFLYYSIAVFLFCIGSLLMVGSLRWFFLNRTN